jgi:hypothetical protein
MLTVAALSIQISLYANQFSTAPSAGQQAPNLTIPNRSQGKIGTRIWPLGPCMQGLLRRLPGAAGAVNGKAQNRTVLPRRQCDRVTRRNHLWKTRAKPWGVWVERWENAADQQC